MRPVSSTPVSGRYLSFAEREEIALMRARRCGVGEIARALGCAPSTISRELRRNAATRGGQIDYRVPNAEWHADRRAKRPKAATLAVNERLRQYVQDLVDGAITRPDGQPAAVPDTMAWKGCRYGRRQDRRWATAWSPEEIARRLTVALAVTCEGRRDILGLWAGDGDEGAKYWLHVLTELKNRGVADVLMVVCDG